jgi:integrase
MASISKRHTASGEPRYDVRYRAGGRPVEEAFKRRQDAENRVRQIEAEKLKGQVVDPRRGREKLADFAERWLEARTVNGKPLAPMTKQGYRGLLRRNIEPTIGQYAVAEITSSVVRDWYSKVAVNAGGDQAAKSYRLLRAILNTAVDDELIGRNPCRIRGGGAEHADERPMMDAALVFRIADKMPPRLRALVLVAGFVGLRTGELLGLRRCDVDLENARVTVFVQAQQVIGQGRIVTGPKSEAGQRTVSLPKVVVEALEKHLANYGQPGAAGAFFYRSARRANHARSAVQGVASGPDGSECTRRPAHPRPPPSRGHVDRSHAGHHHEGTHGPHRPRLTASRAHLPTRHRTTRPRDRRLPRRGNRR